MHRRAQNGFEETAQRESSAQVIARRQGRSEHWFWVGKQLAEEL